MTAPERPPYELDRSEHECLVCNCPKWGHPASHGEIQHSVPELEAACAAATDIFERYILDQTLTLKLAPSDGAMYDWPTEDEVQRRTQLRKFWGFAYSSLLAAIQIVEVTPGKLYDFTVERPVESLAEGRAEMEKQLAQVDQCEQFFSVMIDEAYRSDEILQHLWDRARVKAPSLDQAARKLLAAVLVRAYNSHQISRHEEYFR